MELMTPQILWRDFDTQAPFDETTLRFVEQSGRKIKEFYFSGLRTNDGVIRIFARYLNNGDHLPTLVYFGDQDYQLEIPDITRYNFLAVDYCGVKKGKSRGTIYPASLKDAENTLPVSGIPPRLTKWYAWSAVAMSTALYAQKNCGNGKVAVIGVGQGGSFVWKLSACVAVDAGITLFSNGYEPDLEDLNYRACLDNRSYAPILKFPVMEIVSSNESDGSIDYMSEIFAGIKRSDCRLCINERSNHTLGLSGKKNVELWLRRYLEGEGQVPQTPTLRPYESGGKLYLEVNYDGNYDDMDLYLSVGDVHGAVRNWSNIPLMKLEGGYLATPPVYDVDAPINAFVTVQEGGYKISSAVVNRTPSKMGVVAEQVVSNRLVYDGDMGIDDWTLENNQKPCMKNGPFGISGVSANEALITFKLADVRFRGKEGGLLQIMYSSKVKQKITFVIIDSNKKEFSCSVDADPMQGWITSNFAVEDFKMQNESLRWEDVVTFAIVPSSDQVIVSSLLWV